VPRNATVIEVLIASPYDVAAERDVVERVIHRWNAAHSRATGITLQAVRWETHTHPEMGDRPQGVVNRQIVDHADILIGVFWTKLGTETGEAPSGTAEEIKRFRRAGKKVLVYFSMQGPSLDHFDPKEYQRLLEYKESLKPDGLYGTYTSTENLREQLTSHLAQVVNELHPTVPTLVPLAPGPDPSAQRTAMSRGPLNAILVIEAKWEAERTSSYGNTDQGKWWMAEVTEILAQLMASPVVQGNDAAIARLKDALRTARDIEHWPISYDSLMAFWQEGATLLMEVKDILEEIGRAS